MKAKQGSTKRFLSGNEAIAQGAYEAGLKVACAYPGTPSTEIVETLSHFPEIDSQWSVNEKVAFEVAHAASIGGVRSLYACKHVGLNVAMDPLMTSAYTGVNAGFVIVVADDPGLHSSQNEQDTRWVSVYAKLPLLEPANPDEAYRFIKEAFAISEQFDTPVLLRTTTRISHTKEDVEVSGIRENVAPKTYETNIPKYVMMPKNAYQRHLKLEERLLKLQDFAEHTSLNSFNYRNKKLGIITGSVAYLYAKEAFPDASFLKLGMLYPFCDNKIRKFASEVNELMVIEELDPFLEEHLHAIGIKKVRAKDPSFRVGELRPEFIPIIRRGHTKKEIGSSSKKPVLCAGCPHRFVFNALRKLKTVTTGDIGCYTLAATPPMSALHTCVCMGAGITFHEGMRRAQPDAPVVGVIGDSTFIHSGITGLINAVYNRMRGVIIILDNSTTAMTGGQNHPATGKTITDAPTAKLVLEDLCRACGVPQVDVVDPNRYQPFIELVKKRLEQPVLSVIIARSPCKLITREQHPAPRYTKDLCKKCGLCVNIDCPAILKQADNTITLDESKCAGCYLCTEVCPPKALVKP
jgi:indolepyruvate ferredoxin oxidoreductase alpha subunit